MRADQLALNAMLSGIMEAKIGRWSDREKRYLPLANGDRISAEDKVAILNSKRHAFNGMSQTELAASLDGLARVSARGGAGARKATEFYKAVSQAALNVVITPVDRGGLATFITCTDGARRCAWYHSVTSQGANVARRGALNQHLHVVRDLLRLANGNKDFGYLTDYASYGLNQLFIGPDGEQVSNIPTFATFLGPKGPQGRGAFLTYGFDAKPNGLTTYFLSQAQKNCHYAIHDLDLLAAILKQPTMARTIAAAKALSTGSAVFKADQALRAIDDTGNSGSSEFVCNPSFNYGKSATGRFFAKHF
ncbi:hypothetical protein [Sphingobium sp. AntQ-1]|uniref:hypothetical protein n=1 Tax=Sphingobium sp. AntQ-1 TaxID=2930091 RepID=UPI00234F6659|nr:hypothetical protein [Sphingobium sp. AntQ-1]